MPNKHLAAHLNDHLAGSVTVMEVLDHLASAYEGTDVEQFAAGLRAEIAADREELESLMVRWSVAQSGPRKASAWVAEKLAELKLRADDPAGGAMRLFQATEAVSLGIEGKRGLWRALAAAAEGAPQLGGVDYARLIRRAEDQRERVEAVRLGAAKAALVDRVD